MFTVSIIINTYNRALFLKNALAGLDRLNGGEFEVIVVNGPSTDETSDILRPFDGRVKVGQCLETNLSVSRNIGIGLATGDIVAFLDDDAVPHPDWLQRLRIHYSNDSVGGVGGYTVGRAGTEFQVRKVMCNRYGDDFMLADYFDERAFNKPRSWVFPSLLGTNSSFRRSSIEEIGGFDHTFTYYLDETDVCLRLVDAGYSILFEPNALVWHQFAASHLRNDVSVPRSILDRVRSKSYFISRHGATPWTLERAGRAVDRLSRFRTETADYITSLAESGAIPAAHKLKLERELDMGLAEGATEARRREGHTHGHYDAPVVRSELLPFGKTRPDALRICIVSRGYPPDDETGIPQWTQLLATGLAARGHTVHVVTEALQDATRQFTNGIWLHRIKVGQSDVAWLIERYQIPVEIAAWAAAVRRAIEAIKTFGLDVVSAPIWDLQGIACQGDEDLLVVTSLHTTYALASPHKPEWTFRPLLRANFIDDMVAAERKLLSEAPVLLANSQSIVTDIEEISGLDLSGRVRLALHGVPIPERQRVVKSDAVLRLLFVGRFELRKGIDIALRAVWLAYTAGIKFVARFVGGDLTPQIYQMVPEVDLDAMRRDGVIIFDGVVSRAALEDSYVGADLLLMPSRYESFGLVAIEAMAFGLPVAALSVGGLKEVVKDGQTGFLIAYDDHASQAFADKIEAIASSCDLLATLSGAARKAVETMFSVENMSSQVEKAFFDALGRKNG